MTVLHHDVRAWFSAADARCPETLEIRASAMDLGLQLLANMVQGPELEASLSSLRQCVMWAEESILHRKVPVRTARQD